MQMPSAVVQIMSITRACQSGEITVAQAIPQIVAFYHAGEITALWAVSEIVQLVNEENVDSIAKALPADLLDYFTKWAGGCYEGTAPSFIGSTFPFAKFDKSTSVEPNEARHALSKWYAKGHMTGGSK
jgi:hypothetical protein